MTTERTYGDRQQALADRLHKVMDTGVDNSPHLIVEARAGTGKTTTLIEGLRRVRGSESTLIPSPQQAKVWEAMELSKGRAQTICFVAFNKSIATELQSRVPQGCDAMTMHSLGFKSVQKAFGRVNVNSYRVQDIISELLEKDIRELRRTKPEVIKATEELVGLCKMNLVGTERPEEEPVELKKYPCRIVWEETLQNLASYYDVDTNGHAMEVFDLVPRVLERCKDVARDGAIDFNDMIWIPVVLGLNVYRYDLLLVDECFPADTMVRTSIGEVPIEKIVGHGTNSWQVLSSLDGGKTLEYNKVTAAYRTPRKGLLVRIKHEHGELCCTANHPIWIDSKGWTPAGMVQSGDTLSYLQQANPKGEQNMLSKVPCDIQGATEANRGTAPMEDPNKASKDGLQNLRKSNRTEEQNLFPQMCGDLEEANQESRSRKAAADQDLQADEGSSERDSQPSRSTGSPSENLGNSSTTGDYLYTQRREWSDSPLPDDAVSSVGQTPASLALEPRVCRVQWYTKGVKQSKDANLLQNRHCLANEEDRNRGGRGQSLNKDSESQGSQKEPSPGISRVVSVEVYQPGSQGGCQGSSQKDDQCVYTLTVEKAGCYFADGVLVKNCQDLNRCQQSLAKMSGRRLVLCGDPKQAIYGFAGADSQSMSRMEQQLSITERGCIHLPLTVTRRCGKAIVEEAKKIVPDFEAFETNPEGKVSHFCLRVKDDVTRPHTEQLDYRSAVADGDMILCRCNAPLVSECFRFIRAGRKANIQGRDVGQGLIKTIQKLMKAPLPTLVEQGGTGDDYDGPKPGPTLTYEIETLHRRLDDWLYAEQRKENAKRNPSEQRLVNLQDRRDCLLCFTEGAKTADEVIKKIEQVFTDDKNGSGIKLSSVHKSKGLEAKRVFILMPKESPMPHPMAKTAWEREQEMNIKYVAITRAIEELVFVS